MAYEQRDMSGTLGRNERKTQPNHPDHRGKCIIDGVEYWISAWIKQGPSGKFFSLAFQPKDESTSRVPPQRQSSLAEDDDIPFNSPLVDHVYSMV